jgi:hypothetical protein
MLPILARTSNHVKSLFLLARVRGLPQRIDVQPLLILGFLLPAGEAGERLGFSPLAFFLRSRVLEDLAEER